MKISIITISYNQAHFLERAILSVLNQNYPDLEYIIVDPGSTDKSRDIIEKYRNDFTHIIFEKDNGPADGLKKGFSYATGEIFGFINADDYFLPNAFNFIVDFFKNHKLNCFVSGSGYKIFSNGLQNKITPTKMTLKRTLLGASTIFQQGTFFPKKIYDSVNGFNIHNRTCWDAELFIDFLYSGFTHEVIQKDLAVFYMHNESISGSGRLKKQYYDDLKRIFLEKMGREYRFSDIFLSYLFLLEKKIKQYIQL